MLIDVRDPDIEKTCRTIASCEYIASMSLHGLIIADSYGVPSLWLNEESISSAWKYFDYFTGVGRRNTLAVTYNKPADLTVYEPKLVKNPHFGTLPTTMKRLAAAFPL